MIEITCDLFHSQTPPLWRVAITVFRHHFCCTHNTLMKNFRWKRCSDFKKMLKNLWPFPDRASSILSFSFPSERLLLPARGTVFYWTDPKFLSQWLRRSRTTYHLSKSHRNSQEKAGRCAWSNSRPVWSSRYVCMNVFDAADVWLIRHLRALFRRQARTSRWWWLQ